MKNTDILQSFCTVGNPFVCNADENKFDVCSRFLRWSFDSNSNQRGSLVNMLQAEIQREDRVGDNSPVKKGKHVAKVSSMIVTQVTLNGIVKFLIKYLNIMNLLPTAASTIFDYLCQLFDFYLCSIFHGFIPTEERSRFISGETKVAAPPPDNCREYEVCFVRTFKFVFTMFI